ncbi:hypothetical protein ACP4OV_029564 [Aristida adscensionis]
MPTMTVQSATMRRLRRELQSSQRRAAAHLKPTGGVAKKKPSQPTPSPSPPRFSAPPPSSPAPAGCSDGFAGDTRPDTSRSRDGSAPAKRGLVESDSSSSMIAEGAQVRVRTPVGTLRTGQRLVLWLAAVVVSAAADEEEEEEGYLRVVYNGGTFPRGDPFGAVRVPRSDVRNMPPPHAAAATGTDASVGSSSVTTYGSASGKAGRQRPTVAGKKLPLLRKLEKEMQSTSKAIVACWS